MNHINTMFSQIDMLDMYSQLSILGSWQYATNSAAINAALKLIPEKGDINDIDAANDFYAELKAAYAAALENDQLCAITALSADVATATSGVGEVRNLEDTLAFMQGRKPTEAQFIAEYETRRRSGMRPGIPIKKFVATELANAMQNYNRLVTKGMDAIALIDYVRTHTEETNYDCLPEWMAESLQQKLVEKLHARWEKLESNRTNLRLKKDRRDSAEADQLLVASVLTAHGEKIGYSQEELDEDALPMAGVKSQPQPQPPAATRSKIPSHKFVPHELESNELID